jgi:hypothetical protein
VISALLTNRNAWGMLSEHLRAAIMALEPVFCSLTVRYFSSPDR